MAGTRRGGGDGVAARRLLGEPTSAVSLLLTDVVMPLAGGKVLDA